MGTNIQPFIRYICTKWQYIKSLEKLEDTSIFEHIIWKNRRFNWRQKQKILTVEGLLLARIGYSRVGDFFDADGRLIEVEAMKNKLNAPTKDGNGILPSET